MSARSPFVIENVRPLLTQVPVRAIGTSKSFLPWATTGSPSFTRSRLLIRMSTGDVPPHPAGRDFPSSTRSEEHTSELQSLAYLVCRLLLEKKKDIEYHLRTTCHAI